jgi:hypothetical protein
MENNRYWAIARSFKCPKKHVKDFEADNNEEAWASANKWLTDDLGVNFFLISVAKETLSPGQELIQAFGKKYGQGGMQGYGRGTHKGKECIRVILHRSKELTIKLPKKFRGLRVVAIIVDGKPILLAGNVE